MDMKQGIEAKLHYYYIYNAILYTISSPSLKYLQFIFKMNIKMMLPTQ